MPAIENRSKPPTLWHATASPAAPRPSLEGETSTDLAIIGGGFTGLSTALHAAGAGQKVVMLEAHEIAWGATGRNAGFVVPNFAKMDPDDILRHLGEDQGNRLVDFAASSADLVFELISRYRIECDSLQSGWIQPAHSLAAYEKVKSRANQWAKRGRPVQILNRDEVAALTGARGYVGGWIDRSGGILNPVSYARGLADAAENAGCRIFETSPVVSMARAAGGEWILSTPKGQVTAKKVVMATNAYGGNLDPKLARTYFPLQVFQIATAPLPESASAGLLPARQCVSDTRRNLFTFRFDRQNRLITGGMPVIAAGAEHRVPAAIHRRLARMLDLKSLPPIEFSWSGMASVMPDFLPRLIPLAPNLLAAFACNGRGIAMSTRMGQSLAEWSTGTPVEDLPVPARPGVVLPLHGLLRHAPNFLLPFSMMRDRWDTAKP